MAKKWATRAFLAIWLMTALMIADLAILFGPSYEAVFFPVVSAAPQLVSRSKTLVTFNQKITKYRDCAILSARYYVAPVGNPSNRVSVIVTNEANAPVGTITRPIGSATYGPYTLMLPSIGFDGPFLLSSVAEFDCHPGWITVQDAGPFLIG